MNALSTAPSLAPASRAVHSLTETEIALARVAAGRLPGGIWSAQTEFDYDGRLILVLIPEGDDAEAPSFHLERSAAGVQLGACRWDRFIGLGTHGTIGAALDGVAVHLAG
jgi:hypothetical protein